MFETLFRLRAKTLRGFVYSLTRGGTGCSAVRFFNGQWIMKNRLRAESAQPETKAGEKYAPPVP